MAMQPPPRQPVSPDGRWVWNGPQWVPNTQAQVALLPKPYESARFRSTFVVIFLALNGLALLLSCIVDVAFVAVGGNLNAAGDTVAIGIGVFSLFVLLLLYGSWIPGIVLFCMWLHRIVRNLPWIGAPDPRWTPGGAVGRCFIPGLNFVHPFFSVIDVWKASDPTTARADQPIRNSRPVAPLIAAWWGTYIGGRVVSIFSSRLVNSPDAGTVVVGAFIDIFANVVVAAAAVLAIFMVRQVTARQDAKRDLMTSGRLA
jgi:hypothetical protein